MTLVFIHLFLRNCYEWPSESTRYNYVDRKKWDIYYGCWKFFCSSLHWFRNHV